MHLAVSSSLQPQSPVARPLHVDLGLCLGKTFMVCNFSMILFQTILDNNTRSLDIYQNNS